MYFFSLSYYHIFFVSVSPLFPHLSPHLSPLLQVPLNSSSCPLYFSSFPPLSFCSFFSPSSPIPIAANSERGRPFCGGRGQVDAMWPCRAASPHRAGPQPGVTDGFLLLPSAAVKHRRTWRNQPAAIQGGETTVARSGGFLLAPL